MLKRKIRLMDVVNFVWSSIHDFIYAGIMLAVYWLWHQPEEVRNNVLIASGIAALFVIDAVINYRQHHKLEQRIERLERRKCHEVP